MPKGHSGCEPPVTVVSSCLAIPQSLARHQPQSSNIHIRPELRTAESGSRLLDRPSVGMSTSLLQHLSAFRVRQSPHAILSYLSLLANSASRPRCCPRLSSRGTRRKGALPRCLTHCSFVVSRLFWSLYSPLRAATALEDDAAFCSNCVSGSHLLVVTLGPRQNTRWLCSSGR